MSSLAAMSKHLVTWQGYVVEGLIEACMLAEEKLCKGCHGRCQSLTLHSCKALNVIEHLRKHLPACIVKVGRTGLSKSFDKFSELFPEWEEYRSECVRDAEKLLQEMTPESAYYGRWVPVEVDITIRRAERRRYKMLLREEEGGKHRQSRTTPYSRTLIKTSQLNISSALKQKGQSFSKQRDVLKSPLFTGAEKSAPWLPSDIECEATSAIVAATNELFNLYRNE